MYVSVDLFVKDKITEKPIPGVLVKVFSEKGTDVFGEMVTSTDGKANFLLYGPKRYQARAFRNSTGFTNPTYFDVDPEESSNCFLITGTSIDVPSSTDPRLCLCSGYFRTPSGAPAAGIDIHIINRFKPLLLENAGVVSERVRVRTDPQGWMQTPLIRNGEYDVLIEGYEDVTRKISVPDQASCNFPDLVFEVVNEVIIPDQPLVVPLGDTLDVYPEVYTTTGRRIDGTAKGDVCWTVADTNIVTMTVEWEKIVLYGLASGSTTLMAVRSNTSIVRIPDPPLMSPVTTTVP
jgi:hypothetical protein